MSIVDLRPGESRFDTILVDFDGVLRRWPASDFAIERRFGLPHGSIRAEAFAARRLDRAIRGHVSDARWRRDVAESLQSSHPTADAFGAVDEWSAQIGSIDADVLALLRLCEPSQGIVLFTNATSRLNEDLAAHGLLSFFSSVVNSSETGAAKPQLEAFQAAIRACGSEPDDMIYIDDSIENVEFGCSMGILSHWHRPDRSLEEFLVEVHLLQRSDDGPRRS